MNSASSSLVRSARVAMPPVVEQLVAAVARVVEADDRLCVADIDDQQHGGLLGHGSWRWPPGSVELSSDGATMMVARWRSTHVRSAGRRQPRSSPRSSTGAELVIAPTEIMSTPVAEYSPIVSRVTPPETSSRVRRADGPRWRSRCGDAVPHRVGSHVVQQDRVGSRTSSASTHWSHVSHSTCTVRPGQRSRAVATASVIDDAAQVVVLDQQPVRQVAPVVAAAAGAHRRLGQRPQARARSCGCPRPGPTRRPPRPRRTRDVRVAMPDRWPRKFSAVRSPVRIER